MKRKYLTPTRNTRCARATAVRNLPPPYLSFVRLTLPFQAASRRPSSNLHEALLIKRALSALSLLVATVVAANPATALSFSDLTSPTSVGSSSMEAPPKTETCSPSPPRRKATRGRRGRS